MGRRSVVRGLGALVVAGMAGVAGVGGAGSVAQAQPLDVAFEQARIYAEAADDAWNLGRSLGRRALAALYRGDADAALRHCAHARTIERSTGNWSELALTECIAASAHGRRGDVDAALDTAYDALALTKRSAYEWSARPALSVSLFGASRRGDPDHAATVLADMADLVNPRMAHRWARLAAATLPDLPTLTFAPAPSAQPAPALSAAYPAAAAPADSAYAADAASGDAGTSRTDGDAATPVTVGSGGASLDIRTLPRLGLEAEMSRRTGRPLDPAVARQLARLVAAGARCTLGWPFDLDRFP
jgi:hypothetical protein